MCSLRSINLIVYRAVLAISPWLRCPERSFGNLGIEGSSPDGAERQFIFILFHFWGVDLSLNFGCFFNVADHV